MPQYLRKVTPEYALKYYNVVIGTPITPTSSNEEMKNLSDNFEVTYKETENSKSTTIKRTEPEEKNGDLF